MYIIVTLYQIADLSVYLSIGNTASTYRLVFVYTIVYLLVTMDWFY